MAVCYYTFVSSRSLHNLSVFIFSLTLLWSDGGRADPSPNILNLRILPQRTDWIAAPVVLNGSDLPANIDPRSIRLYRAEKGQEENVPIRLKTEGIPPRLVWVAWIKEGTGPIEYVLTYDSLDSRQTYQYPDELPMVGCGEPLAFGSRSSTGWMTASYNSTYEAVDWDGDGDADLFSSQSGPAEASTLRGIYYYENLGPQTPGILSSPERLSEETGQVSVIDWNRDGKLDLVVGRKVLLGVGPRGSFLFEEPSDIEGLEGGAHCFTDWDKDGLLDVLTGQSDSSRYRPPKDTWNPSREAPYTPEGIWKGGRTEGWLLFQRNIGNPTFPKFDKGVPLLPKGKDLLGVHGSIFPCRVDWNRDGLHELLCGGVFWMYLFSCPDLLTVGKGRLTLSPGEATEGIYIRPAPVDWDGDGALDLILGQENGFAMLVENRDQEGLKDPVILPGQAPLLDAGCLSTPTLCDWNGDGILDLISGNSYGEVLVFESSAEGQSPSSKRTRPFHWGRTSPTHLPIHIQAGPNGSIQGPEEARYGYTNTEVCDWDGDGLLDLLLSDVWGRNRWYRNIGTKEPPMLSSPRNIEVSWEGPPPKPAWVWWQPEKGELVNVWRTKPESVDWNRDGHIDLVTLDHEGYLSLFERIQGCDGDWVLSPGQRIFVDGKGQPLHFGEGVAGRAGRGKFDIVDWDNDGDRDLLAYEFDTLRSVGYYQNTGNDSSPVMEYQGDLLVPLGIILAGHSTTPAALDFDQDGIKDLLVGCEDGLIYAFHRAFLENDLPKVTLIEIK